MRVKFLRNSLGNLLKKLSIESDFFVNEWISNRLLVFDWRSLPLSDRSLQPDEIETSATTRNLIGKANFMEVDAPLLDSQFLQHEA